MVNVRKKKEEEKRDEFFSLRMPLKSHFDNMEEYEKQLLAIRKKRHDFQINRLKKNTSKIRRYDTMFFLSIWESMFQSKDYDYLLSFSNAKRSVERYFKFILLLKAKTHTAASVSNRLKGLGLSPDGLNKTDTPPTTTISTLRVSAAIFRRAGTLA
jgi:hypothetical protein